MLQPTAIVSNDSQKYSTENGIRIYRDPVGHIIENAMKVHRLIFCERCGKLYTKGSEAIEVRQQSDGSYKSTFETFEEKRRYHQAWNQKAKAKQEHRRAIKRKHATSKGNFRRTIYRLLYPETRIIDYIVYYERHSAEILKRNSDYRDANPELVRKNKREWIAKKRATEPSFKVAEKARTVGKINNISQLNMVKGANMAIRGLRGDICPDCMVRMSVINSQYMTCLQCGLTLSRHELAVVGLHA